MKIVIREWLKDKKATRQAAVYFICMLIWYIAEARMIIMIGKALDRHDLTYGVNLILGICIVRAGSELIGYWYQKSSTYECFVAMHNRFADKVLDADYELFTYFSVAKVTTIGEFMGNVTSVFKGMLRQVINGINILIILGSMASLGGTVIIPVIVLYAFCGLMTEYLYKKYQEQDKELNELRKARNQKFEDIINGFQEMRSFSMIEYERENLKGMNQKLHGFFNRKAKMGLKANTTIEVIDAASLVFVVWYSMRLIISMDISAAAAMSMIMFVIKIMNPLMTILDWVDELSDNLKVANDYEKLIKWENKVKKGTLEMDKFEKEIRLKDVHFAYQNSSTVLNGVSFTVPKGTHVGICGKTGDGKSTLLKLLNKFYNVSSGHIFIDGVDLDCITAESYRRHVGSVHQENFIFPGTILENVKFGTPSATEYEIIEACKKAKLYDFITSLKDGFQTDVGPKGLKLSGGQKQRIALARLFLQDPEIIILDEATSSLDNETELLVQDAIRALQNKTIITVAHRLTTIKDCDCIYVLDGGKIVEHGTHSELMELHGEYYSMYMK